MAEASTSPFLHKTSHREYESELQRFWKSYGNEDYFVWRVESDMCVGLFGCNAIDREHL